MFSSGSSPRMRGTLTYHNTPHFQLGIIPAHAGNTSCLSFFCYSLWDHPRACGEHTEINPELKDVPGSSPRMRGTQAGESATYTATGIIPAHAGNTMRVPVSAELNRDHPRACGEHSVPGTSLCSQTGSSPRMRGTPTHCLSVRRATGIIPAHAGNTPRGCCHR